MIDTQAAYVAFHQQLRRFITKRLGNAEDAEDILQEVFLRVLRSETPLQEVRTPLAWLYTVTNSAILDHFRKQGRRVPAGQALIDTLPAPDRVEEAEFGRCLTPLLHGLPAKYRDALIFVDLNGGRQVDLARETGLHLSTVKSRVQRGRKMLEVSIKQTCHIQRDGLRKVMDLSPESANETCC